VVEQPENRQPKESRIKQEFMWFAK